MLDINVELSFWMDYLDVDLDAHWVEYEPEGGYFVRFNSKSLVRLPYE